MSKKKKEKKVRVQSLNKRAILKMVMTYMRDNPNKGYNYKQIANSLGIDITDKRQLVLQVLQEQVDAGKLLESERGKYMFELKEITIEGLVDMTSNGAAYIVSDEMEEDVFVPQNNLNHALHGDKVKVALYAKRKKSAPMGEVVEIIERNRKQFVGIVSVSKHFAFLVIEDRKMPYDLFIPKDKLNGATDGQKAIAKIIEWPEKAKNPIAAITEVLGNPGEHETEMHAILAEFELPYHFPKAVETAANRISDKITAEDVANRRDFREVPTFTIDPADAKDFDDALSLQQLQNGNWQVGIHIADVTHYVKPNTVLDREGLERATSVYLVDRVVPMLPERLSNNICSLRPNEDKLCFAAVFEMNNNAEILDSWVGRTIINSDRRFAYEEAQYIIDTQETDQPMANQVLKLHELALILRNNRYKNGSISFDRIEVKFHLDEKGKPTGVYFKEAKAANHLIEEFMLLANKHVATIIGKPADNTKPKAFVYRIHDEPDPEKLGSFSNFITRFGYSINTTDSKTVAKSLNRLLKNVEGKIEQNAIENLAIRSMAKAEYSTNNIGHYGLAFDYYTHFTSPIRRYPDMMVHRLLERYLDGKKSANKSQYEQMSKHSSEMERRAAQAERASVKYKQVEFMADKVGDVFEGAISGVTEWGMYVELSETKIEGMISLKSLDDDFYFFDEKNFAIIGQYSEKRFQLGDIIRVKVLRVDMAKKQLDFGFYREEEAGV